MKPASKLPNVGTTIFTVMSRMASDYDAINLSQGYPDFPVPLELLERLTYYAARGENQYPPMHGVAYLREQIAKKLSDCYEISVDMEDEVTITSGATEALFVAIHAIVTTDDEVIVFDPAYDSYDPAITLAGGKTIHLPLVDDDFHVDWEQLEHAVNRKTRAIIVNSPHNPTGAVFSKEDLDHLAEIVRDTDVIIISDEVYEHMVFDDKQHHTIAAHPELRDRSFVISSFGKTYHATGWKVGYCIASKHLSNEFRKVHQFVTFTTHTPTQWAIADFLDNHPEHHQKLSAFYQVKRDLFLGEMQGLGFGLIPTAGTYFQLASFEKLSTKKDTEFAEHLTKTVGVAAIPVSVFYQDPPGSKVIRFCFAKEDQTLKEAVGRLREHFT